MQEQPVHSSTKSIHQGNFNDPPAGNHSPTLTKSTLYLVAAAYGNGKIQKNGQGYLTLCPLHQDTRPSLSLMLDSNGQFTCYCHAGCNVKAVRERIEADFPQFFQVKRKEPRHKKPLPEYIYTKAEPLDQRALSYFCDTRDIILADGVMEAVKATFRLNTYRGSTSIVAPMSHKPGGKIHAIHQIFLDDAAPPAKIRQKYQGSKSGSAIWLGNIQKSLAIGEGVETCLSFFAATGIPVAIAGDASNLKNLTIPDTVSRLYLLIDQYTAKKGMQGQKAAVRAAEHYKHVEVWFVTPSSETFGSPTQKLDFNDLSSDEIKKRLAEASKSKSPARVVEKQDTIHIQKVRCSDAVHGEETISTAAWPHLQEKALPGIIGDFVGLATEDSEADPAAVLATLLVRTGVEIGDAPHFMVGETVHRLRLAAVIAGASSKARKGTSGRPVANLFSRYLPEVEESWQGAQTSNGPFSSGEGIVYAVRDPIKAWDRETQAEVVQDPGVADKRLFVMDEEFANVLTAAKRDGNKLSMIIRQAWDSGNIAPLIKNRKISTTRAHIGWVSHITIAELTSKLSESEALNGFGNRILWVCAKRPKLVPLPSPIPPEKMNRIASRLAGIIENAKSCGRIYMSNRARAYFTDIYPDLSQSKPGLAGSIVSRAEAQVIRLSMLYALFDEKRAIDTNHIESALAFWKYCEDSAFFIFQGKSENSYERKIMNALNQRNTMTGTELRDLFHRHLSKDTLTKTIRNLVALGEITVETRKTRGRPVTIYKKANPAELSSPSHRTANTCHLDEPNGVMEL